MSDNKFFGGESGLSQGLGIEITVLTLTGGEWYLYGGQFSRVEPEILHNLGNVHNSRDGRVIQLDKGLIATANPDGTYTVRDMEGLTFENFGGQISTEVGKSTNSKALVDTVKEGWDKVLNQDFPDLKDVKTVGLGINGSYTVFNGAPKDYSGAFVTAGLHFLVGLEFAWVPNQGVDLLNPVGISVTFGPSAKIVLPMSYTEFREVNSLPPEEVKGFFQEIGTQISDGVGRFYDIFLEQAALQVQQTNLVTAGMSEGRGHVSDFFSQTVEGATKGIVDASNNAWDKLGQIVKEAESRIVDSARHCFLSGTRVSIDQDIYKDIEKIRVGDQVRCFDSLGNLQMGRVRRTYKNKSKNVIDYFGLFVTFEHNFLTIGDDFKRHFDSLYNIIGKDGVLFLENGEQIRASTGQSIYSIFDKEVEIIFGDRIHMSNEIRVTSIQKSRLGNRLFLENGRDISILDIFLASEKLTLGHFKNYDKNRIPKRIYWPFENVTFNRIQYFIDRSRSDRNMHSYDFAIYGQKGQPMEKTPLS